jgi:hypothetical protein
LDLYLEIDTKGKLNTKLYDKRDDFNFPFLSNNIPFAPRYGVYVSQLAHMLLQSMREYHDVLLDRTSWLTQKLQKQGYVAPRLLSSLKRLYGRHHVLIDRYEISASQIGTDLGLLSSCWGFFPLTGRDYQRTDRDRHVGCVATGRNCYSSGAPGFTLIRSRVRLARVCLYFMYFVSFCCSVVSWVCIMSLDCPFGFSFLSLFNNRFNRYRIMFILTKSNRRKGNNNCTGPHREDID